MVALTLLSLVAAFWCVESFHRQDKLMPADESILPWRAQIRSNSNAGYTENTSGINASNGFQYNYLLTDDVRFPYALFSLIFGETDSDMNLVDLSRYSSVSFNVRCSQKNTLGFHLHSFDNTITQPSDFYSFRVAVQLFSCDEEWSRQEVNLHHLTVPFWWYSLHNVDIVDQRYDLAKVAALSFDSSRKGPLNTRMEVRITDLTLSSENWVVVWWSAALIISLWVGYFLWAFRQYIACLKMEVKARLQADRQLIAYQQISIQPELDRKKNQLLKIMACEFANPDMNLDFVIAETGINRNKINDLLKDEMGMTFSAYLNSLRLSAAATQLVLGKAGSISALALEVGYNNASYFNKLFKEQYGCSPKKFKALYKHTNTPC